MNNKNTHAYMQAAVNVVFTQIHENKGINMFGERAIAETIKELKKLDEELMPVKTVVIPLKPDELTDVESSQSLEAVNLSKGEINGVINGLTCANGIKQKIYLT